MDNYRRRHLDRTRPEWKSDDQTLFKLADLYEGELRKLQLIDFEDMPLLPVRALAQNPWLQKAIVAKYPILAVDEYQDLGVALHKMVMGLCFSAGMRLFAVGDVDQSIYGFTGAYPGLLRRLSERDDIETIQLGLNYRCGTQIVAASEFALGEERGFRAPDGAHEGTIYFHPGSGTYTAQAVKLMNELIPEIRKRQLGLDLGEIGILYPAAYLGDEVASAAAANGFSVIRTDSKALYPRSNRMMRWLEQCAMWCCGGWRSGKPRFSRVVNEGSRLFHETMTCEEDRLFFRRALLAALWDRRDHTLGLHDWLAALRNEIISPRVALSRSLDDDLATLDGFIDRLAPTGDAGYLQVVEFAGNGSGLNRINLSTLHSAKGREFDVVILFGMDDGQIPRKNSSLSQVQEARRLFYVGLTRARYEVHLVYGSSRPSRIVSEIEEHLATTR